MRSDLPKVLHRLAGAPMLLHAMKAGREIEAERSVVVVGFGGEAVKAVVAEYDEDAVCVSQDEQLGTGHAVAQAADALSDFDGNVIVLYGDTPFISTETMEDMLNARAEGAAVVILGFEATDPGRYGRLKTGGDGLEKIIEAKDATPEELRISLCNSGVICCDREVLFSLVDQVDNINAGQEYYLTSIVGIARSQGLNCAVVTCDEVETLGINSRNDLAHAEAIFQANARYAAMENGVTLYAPDTVYFAFDTMIGRDVSIAQNVVFGPGVTIESGAEINAFCHLEGCHISRDAKIGPFARLRPGAEIGEEAKVGNFVEIKEAVLDEGAKVSHLSYIGDAHIGKGANIGAGTITCNYDGVFKHHTEIGAGAFIGSNSALVAPVTIGAEAIIGSGSVITGDVKAGDLAIGRGRQVNKPGLGHRFMDHLRDLKAKGKS